MKRSILKSMICWLLLYHQQISSRRTHVEREIVSELSCIALAAAIATVERCEVFTKECVSESHDIITAIIDSTSSIYSRSTLFGLDKPRNIYVQVE